MTTIELIQTVQDLASEETFGRFSKAEIIRWLNRGLEDIAIKTGYLTWKWKITTTANKREYPYPATAKSIYRMEYDGKPLSSTDFPVLDEALEEWQAATGAPENWYHSWNRAFGVYPTPNDVYNIYAYGFDRGATLADDADIPLIPDLFHIAPAYFAARQIVREDKELSVSASLNKDYMLMIADMITERESIVKRSRGKRLKVSRATVEEG